MVVITYNKNELIKLIGKKLNDKQLVELIERFKTNVEEISENEIKVEHTSDRIDMFSIEGFAKTLRLFIGLEKPKKPKFRDFGKSLLVKKVKARPYALAFVVKNVKIDEEFLRSLMNIQEVLHLTIGRKRRKIAIGIHDLDKISFPIVYEEANKKEKFTPLGYFEEMSLEEVFEKTEKGKEYADLIKKFERYPVYRDKKGIFSFPPILNSERTRVTTKTKNLLVEVTGIDETTVKQTINILAFSFLERGFKVYSLDIKKGKKKIKSLENRWEKFLVRKEEIENLLGIKLTSKRIVKILEKLGYLAKVKNNLIEVEIPPYRIDILHEWDIIEDIAIGYGYENFEPELPNIFTKGSLSKEEEILNRIREIMVGLGYQEILTPVLSSKEKQFKRMGIKEKEVVEIENPVSNEYTCLRISLIPSLLYFYSKNKHREFPQLIFEIGKVVHLENKKPIEKNYLAFGISDSVTKFSELRASISFLFKLIWKKFEIQEAKDKRFIEGRCGKIFVNNKEVGIFGEINPEILENWKIEMPTVIAEIDLSFLFK
ncbi:MAG: phenylalanine--tRNA ligase subunit beta [Candidatus Aenigmarchaeota archaeon ex4484_224]|nr:MAG: phenylalanine--tRNA ligase subunit beta [Candidatus Aenigmarchaeota archaeon ex4484_224]